MKKTILVAIVTAGIVALWIAPAAGQDARPDVSQGVVHELAGIRESLDDLVNLLSTMRRNQDVELVLRRIEMHERRLAPMARELESNKREQVETERRIEEVENWVRQAEERIREIEREGREEVPLAMHHEVATGEAELERLAERVETARRQQIEIENSLLGGRDEIEILDDLLEELLD